MGSLRISDKKQKKRKKIISDILCKHPSQIGAILDSVPEQKGEELNKRLSAKSNI